MCVHRNEIHRDLLLKHTSTFSNHISRCADLLTYFEANNLHSHRLVNNCVIGSVTMTAI